MTPPHQQTLVKKISDLWNLTDANMAGPLVELYLAELLELSGCMITEFQNSQILIVSLKNNNNMIFKCINGTAMPTKSENDVILCLQLLS